MEDSGLIQIFGQNTPNGLLANLLLNAGFSQMEEGQMA